jgi:hypothetical protein
MPTVTTIQPYLPVRESLVQPSTGVLTPVGLAWFQAQAGNIANMATAINVVPGVNVFTVATQPSLGAGDAGYLGWLSDYLHPVRWTGATWQFFGSDNNYFSVRPGTPQGGAWALCDGSTTKYLTLGATLTETNFTTPDLVSTPAYFKSIAAYTGTVNAKGGATAAGSTSPDTTGSGTTGSSTDTFTTGTNSATATADEKIPPDATATLAAQTHTHSGTTDGHTHTQAGLSIPALTVSPIGVGTIEMSFLGVRVWFRR